MIRCPLDPRSARRPHLVYWVSVLSLLVPFVVVSVPEPAAAATIEVVYDPSHPEAVDPCDEGFKACDGGDDHTDDLRRIVEAAAAHYADAFEEAHEVTIFFFWTNSSSPFASVLSRNDDGQPLTGRIGVPANPDDHDYFYDPTPHSDEEFEMRPRLYRTTHHAEQDAAFDGSPPEFLEIGYLGERVPGVEGVDLMTIILHEMGHALGLSGGPLVGPGPACDGNSDPFYRPHPSLTAGSAVGLRAFPHSQDGDKCAHLDIGGIRACKTDPEHTVGGNSDAPSTIEGFTLFECASHQALMHPDKFPRSRARPSLVDWLTIQEAGGWQAPDMPRKYSVGRGGTWRSGNTWLGARSPGHDDDVYIVNRADDRRQTTVTSLVNAAARNIYISDENRLEISFSRLLIGEELRLAGRDSVHGPVNPKQNTSSGEGPVLSQPVFPSIFEAGLGGLAIGNLLSIERQGQFRLQQGRAQFGDVNNGGTIEGHGTLGVTRGLQNQPLNPNGGRASGIIRADGGLLRIVTPEGGGGVTTGPLLVDLGGSDLHGVPPDFAPRVPRLLAVDGDVQIDAVVAGGVLADIRIGSGRTLEFARDRFDQGATSDSRMALRFEGFEQGQPRLVAPHSSLRGLVTAESVGRIDGPATFAGTARLRLALRGPVAGGPDGYSQLRIHGLTRLGGRLEISLSGGFEPEEGDSFTVLQYEDREGEFDVVDLPPLENGLGWEVHYEQSGVRLAVVIDTDVNDDGETDALDLIDILLHFGACPSGDNPCPWDLNNDGVVNEEDVLIWEEHSGMAGGLPLDAPTSILGESTTVPGPLAISGVE